jgi:hypothetical protein
VDRAFEGSIIGGRMRGSPATTELPEHPDECFCSECSWKLLPDAEED